MDFKFQRENLSCFCTISKRRHFRPNLSFSISTVVGPIQFWNIHSLFKLPTIKFFFSPFCHFIRCTIFLLCCIYAWLPYARKLRHFEWIRLPLLGKFSKKSDKCIYTKRKRVSEKRSEMATERSKHQRRIKRTKKSFCHSPNDQVFIFNYFVSAEKQLLKGRYRDESEKSVSISDLGQKVQKYCWQFLMAIIRYTAKIWKH